MQGFCEFCHCSSISKGPSFVCHDKATQNHEDPEFLWFELKWYYIDEVMPIMSSWWVFVIYNFLHSAMENLFKWTQCRSGHGNINNHSRHLCSVFCVPAISPAWQTWCFQTWCSQTREKGGDFSTKKIGSHRTRSSILVQSLQSSWYRNQSIPLSQGANSFLPRKSCINEPSLARHPWVWF